MRWSKDLSAIPIVSQSWFVGVQIVVHIGGPIRGSSRREFLEVNAEGTKRSAEGVVRTNSKCPPRFLLISSFAARFATLLPMLQASGPLRLRLKKPAAGALRGRCSRHPRSAVPGTAGPSCWLAGSRSELHLSSEPNTRNFRYFTWTIWRPRLVGRTSLMIE